MYWIQKLILCSFIFNCLLQAPYAKPMAASQNAFFDLLTHYRILLISTTGNKESVQSVQKNTRFLNIDYFRLKNMPHLHHLTFFENGKRENAVFKHSTTPLYANQIIYGNVNTTTP